VTSPSITVSPPSVSVSVVTGQKTQTPLISIGGGPATVQVSASGPGLNGGSATAPGPFSATVDASNISPGNYTGTLTFGCVPACATQSVAVNITVTSPPSISVSPSSITVSVTSGQQTLTPTLSISGSTTSVQVTASGPGLSGGSTSSPSNFAASIDATGLSPGTYTGTLTFSCVSISCPDQTVSVTIRVSAAALLTASPDVLTFSAVQGGNAPGSRTVVVTAGNTPAGFAVQVDGGTPGSGAPSWLTVQPPSGSTPAVLTATANPGTLPASTLNARILIVPDDQLQAPIVIVVTFTITAAPPQLTVAPQNLQFSASFGSSAVQEQALLIRNAGSGNVTFAASVLGASTWIKTLSPASGQTTPNVPVIVKVDVSAQGLAAGIYSDTIRFISANKTIDVPVTLEVRASGPALKLGATGFLFETVQGNGISDIQSVSVLNTGDPGTTVNFSASLLSGSDWLNVIVSKSQAAAGSPGILTLQPNSKIAGLLAGARTAVVQVIDSNAQNSPQFLTAVLQVDTANTAAPPDPSPAGVFLIAGPGRPQPTASVVLNYSSANPAFYQTSVSTMSGGNWLNASPASGLVSTAAPVNLTLSANPSGLAPGIYAGTVNIIIGSVLRTVHATLEVVPGTGTNANPNAREAGGCTPRQLVLVETALPDNFQVLAGYPSLLSIQANDDCGNPVLDATVIAQFTNSDAPLRLDSDRATGFYSATWTPSHIFTGLSVSFDATEPGGLLPPSGPAVARLSGNVGANPNLLPVLSLGGTVNNSNPVQAAPLAPGTIASVYGSQLATSAALTPSLPLVKQFQGTSIQIGSIAAPLFYVSPTQLNIQIPFELAPNQSYAILATVNGMSSVPDRLSVAPATPGVIAFPDNTTKAQHADGSFVNAAKPGELLAMYLVGMGVTNPPVASGAVAPFDPHPATNFPPTVTLDGIPASLQFPGGLVGGSVGLYQINFTVPMDTSPGTLKLVVTQNGFAANVTQLIVAR
jgi:uncharacterized protein (TIGR03437 family)